MRFETLNSENSRDGIAMAFPRRRRLIVSIPKSLIRKLETANVISQGRDSKLGVTTRPEELEPYCLNYNVNNSKLRHYWALRKLSNEHTDSELFRIQCINNINVLRKYSTKLCNGMWNKILLYLYFLNKEQ